MIFEMRQIDALYYIDGWTWNSSYLIGYMYTKARNEKRAFTRWLRNNGVTFKTNSTRIEYDGHADIYEITDRRTHEPLFAAIPIKG
jgi:hypothetical protein